MKEQAVNGIPARRPQNWKGVYVAAGLLLLAVMLVLSLLAAQLMQELSRLRSASTDNVQWSMAQVQVELLVLESAVDDAIHNNTPQALDEVRQRFDIFYSRIDTLQQGSVFSGLTLEIRTRQVLDHLMDTLNRFIRSSTGPMRHCPPLFPFWTMHSWRCAPMSALFR